MQKILWAGILATALAGGAVSLVAEEGANPEINKKFDHPDVADFAVKWECDNREIFSQREAILAACGLKAGMDVADIGAGTGLFTRLMAGKVTPGGNVFAVDISKAFIAHILETCSAAKISNVIGVVCRQDDSRLKPGSVDFVFICDTYHHFEHPRATMRSVVNAMRPGARLVLVDFKRGQDASDFIKGHVRADKDVFQKEIESDGLRFVEDVPLLKENYFIQFIKPAAPAK